jgi:Skp family chaperone for outer membrane proteins
MKRVAALLTFGIMVSASSAFAQGTSLSFHQGARPAAPPQPAAPPAPPPAILQRAVPTFPASVKIGFINLQTIAQESAAGKDAALQLRKLQDVKLLDIQARNQAIKALQDRQAASTVLSAAAAAQLQKDLDRAQMDLQYTQQMAQKEVEDLQRDLMSAFSDKVAPIVEQVRAEKELWAVWTVDDRLAAIMPSLDLSLEVVKRLDAQK